MRALTLAFLPFLFACSQETPRQDVLRIGLIGKSQSNPVFQAAHAGARAAAKELGPRYGKTIEIDWRTPPLEDAQKQAEALSTLARSGVPAIALACSDANALTKAIDDAIQLGALVMTFDSDAAQSRRLTCYGTDDLECGRRVMAELAQAMGEKGTVAILAGNQTAPNLQVRVRGVREELARHPGMRLLDDGIFYHEETPELAAQRVQSAQSTHPEIQGWAMVGGWALFTKNALPWPPGQVKVVAVDALPAQLHYLESGHVAVLLAQDCHGWGRKSVEVLLARLLAGQTPPPRIVDPLTRVTRANAAEWAGRWRDWLGGR